MRRYIVSEKSWYSESWLWLGALFIIAILAWIFLSPLYTIAIAALGLVMATIIRSKGKKRIGDYVELTDNGIIFCEAGDHSCIAYNEIKNIKLSSSWLPSDPAFLLETSIGNKKKLQPDDYENGDELREMLNANFKAFECKFIK
ncbi:MAG: hypothetical protein ACM3PE_00195 [Deltaproteobacteria bacterium]